MLAASELEPLILADGTRIDPTTGKAIKEKRSTQRFVEIPSASEAQEIVARTRRSIAEMPMPPQQMNTVSLVLFYTLWGLSKQDVAVAVGISLAQVKNIMELAQYKQISADLQKNILQQEATDIRAFFQKNAMFAAEGIVDAAAEEGVLGFKAKQDILDRAGFRPADVVEHKHSMESSLKIEYIRKEAPADVPVIETSYRDITNGNRS